MDHIKVISNDNNKFFMIDYSITRDLLQQVDGIVSPRCTVLLKGGILRKLPFVVFPENNLMTLKILPDPQSIIETFFPFYFCIYLKKMN